MSSQSYGFSSGHVWMWELDCKESWAPKNWCFWTVVLEKTLESPLNCKEFQPVNPKGNQSWTFTGRTDAEAETPTLWPPEEKNWLIRKDPDAGKERRQEEKGIRSSFLLVIVWLYVFWGKKGLIFFQQLLSALSPPTHLSWYKLLLFLDIQINVFL